jgi:hypothetical protein
MGEVLPGRGPLHFGCGLMLVALAQATTAGFNLKPLGIVFDVVARLTLPHLPV